MLLGCIEWLSKHTSNDGKLNLKYGRMFLNMYMKEPDATATAVTMTPPMRGPQNDTPLTWCVWLCSVNVEGADCSRYFQ